MVHNILNELMDAVIEFDSDKTVAVAKKALKMGVDPAEAIEKGLAQGLRTVGSRFENGELFIMHLAAAAAAATKAIDEVLQPEIVKRRIQRKGAGLVLIGTVEGDIHDIGKHLVAAMLMAGGFNVIDMGTDVPTEEFIKKAKEMNPDIVAVSALLSTTLPAQRKLIEALKTAGVRDKLKVMVGGAPVTPQWAAEIGADGTAEDAVGAVRLAERLRSMK